MSGLMSEEVTLSHAQEYHSALKDLLASDEDLANLYLSYKATAGKPRLASDHAEAEVRLSSMLLNAVTRIVLPNWLLTDAA